MACAWLSGKSRWEAREGASIQRPHLTDAADLDHLVQRFHGGIERAAEPQIAAGGRAPAQVRPERDPPGAVNFDPREGYSRCREKIADDGERPRRRGNGAGSGVPALETQLHGPGDRVNAPCPDAIARAIVDRPAR